MGHKKETKRCIRENIFLQDDHANQNGFHTPQDSRQRIAFLEKRCEDLERELEVQRSHAKEGSLISEMSSIGKREDTGVTSDEVIVAPVMRQYDIKLMV